MCCVISNDTKWHKWHVSFVSFKWHKWHNTGQSRQHVASTCNACPNGNGASWCNGDCTWNSQIKECLPKANLCLTKSGPSSNQPCIFPFIWYGKTYNGCPIDPDDSSQRWCSTKVDSNGNHITGQGNWGHCSSKCPKQN